MQTQNFNEVLGIVGGIIAIFYFVAIAIAESFNYYVLRYKVGKELYLTPVTRKKKKKLLN